MPDRQVGHKRVGRKIQPNTFQVSGRFLVNSFAIQHPELVRFVAEKNIRRDIEIIRQVEFLMDQRDAILLRVPNRPDLNRPAIQFNGALIRRVHPGENLHHRAFAGTVLAHQGQNLTLIQGEVDIVQRPNPGKLLSDCGDFQQWLGVRH